MTTKKPYEPPTYGMVNKAIERRIAGLPPASETEEDADEKSDLPPLNKMGSAPANKAKATPKKKGAK